jgi:hypothetical protein
MVMGFSLKIGALLRLNGKIDRGLVVCYFGDSYHPDVLLEKFALK